MPSPMTSSMPSVVEACPDTVKCMVGCNGPYNLTTTGKTCPDCQCLEKGYFFFYQTTKLNGVYCSTIDIICTC